MKSQLDWMDAALAKHVKPAEVAKQKTDRVRLQAALRSDKKADRDAAKAEIAKKVRPAKKR